MYIYLLHRCDSSIGIGKATRHHVFNNDEIGFCLLFSSRNRLSWADCISMAIKYAILYLLIILLVLPDTFYLDESGFGLFSEVGSGPNRSGSATLLYLLGNPPCCDRIRPPWSQVTRKLTSPFSTLSHSLPTPNSQYPGQLCASLRRLQESGFSCLEHLSLIFNRHFKFLCWGSKSFQIFYLFRTLFEAPLNVFKLLYLCPEIILTLNAFFWLAIGFPAFSSIIALFASWKLLELLYIGPEHKFRRIVYSTSVPDLNRAAPATFRTKIEQIRTHFEQPQ